MSNNNGIPRIPTNSSFQTVSNYWQKLQTQTSPVLEKNTPEKTINEKTNDIASDQLGFSSGGVARSISMPPIKNGALVIQKKTSPKPPDSPGSPMDDSSHSPKPVIRPSGSSGELLTEDDSAEFNKFLEEKNQKASDLISSISKGPSFRTKSPTAKISKLSLKNTKDELSPEEQLINFFQSDKSVTSPRLRRTQSVLPSTANIPSKLETFLKKAYKDPQTSSIKPSHEGEVKILLNIYKNIVLKNGKLPREEAFAKYPGFYKSLCKLLLQECTYEKIGSTSGVYIASLKDNNPLFVIKPLVEEHKADHSNVGYISGILEQAVASGPFGNNLSFLMDIKFEKENKLQELKCYVTPFIHSLGSIESILNKNDETLRTLLPNENIKSIDPIWQNVDPKDIVHIAIINIAYCNCDANKGNGLLIKNDETAEFPYSIVDIDHGEMLPDIWPFKLNSDFYNSAPILDEPVNKETKRFIEKISITNELKRVRKILEEQNIHPQIIENKLVILEASLRLLKIGVNEDLSLKTIRHLQTHQLSTSVGNRLVVDDRPIESYETILKELNKIKHTNFSMIVPNDPKITKSENQISIESVPPNATGPNTALHNAHQLANKEHPLKATIIKEIDKWKEKQAEKSPRS